MSKRKKITPFNIKKISPKKWNSLMKEYNDLSDVKSLIHFLKYLKDHELIMVNKEFKKNAIKDSIVGSVASLSLAACLMTFAVPKMGQDKDKKVLPTVESGIEQIIDNNEPNIGPVLSDESIMEMNSYYNNDGNIGSTILFPKASNTNEQSDYTNYYKVKEKYGSYIEKLSEEFGIDARLLTALVAQENPNNKDMSSYGSYGPLCITKVHDGQTYSYNHFVNGEFVKDNATISIDNIKNNELEGIRYGAILLSYNFNQFSKNDNYTPEENLMFAVAAFNKGNGGVQKAIRNCSDFNEACYSIRYTHAKDYKYDDDQYLEHVLNKIPDEELNLKPFTIISSTGKRYRVSFERNNEIPSICINKTIENKKSI